MRWTSFVARQAEKLGWSWAYWQFDSDFIVYDVKKDAWVEPIRRALIPAPASPGAAAAGSGTSLQGDEADVLLFSCRG